MRILLDTNAYLRLVVDVRCLAYAHVLDMRAVTDDGDMTELANSFDIPVMATLALLKLMLETELCTMKKVRSVFRYWIAVSDLPRNWRTDYAELFGEEPPYESHE